MSRTRPVAVNIHATSPEFIGPPVTACGAALKNAPATLAIANRRNGSAENSRIRSVLLLTCASVIGRAPPLSCDDTSTVPLVHEIHVTVTHRAVFAAVLTA